MREREPHKQIHNRRRRREDEEESPRAQVPQPLGRPRQAMVPATPALPTSPAGHMLREEALLASEEAPEGLDQEAEHCTCSTVEEARVHGP
jgi:hypothetical protein